jgi:putative ATPase
MGWSTDAASSSQPQPPSSQPSIPTSSQTLLEEPLSQPSAVDYPQLPHLTTRVVHTIVSLAGGDARTALSLLELVLNSSSSVDEEALLTTLRSSVSTSYDRTGDDRYGTLHFPDKTPPY